jgi:peptidoglycan/xylan/chitin deacetylase (PgdA/CDA1 family)
MTRRLLLSIGGITLLAGCSSQLPRAADVAQTRPATPGGSRSARATGSATPPSRPRRGVPAHSTSTPTARPGTGGRHASNGGPVYTVHDGAKAIALTIDDGPSAEYTPQVLHLLARYKVTATFSMIGIQVAAEPAIAREVVAAGHRLSNHTYRHLDLGWLAPSAAMAEMDRATDAIHKATGVTPQMFRAPYGIWSTTVLRHCQQTGMMPIDWSVDPRDWARPGVSAIVANIMDNTRTGSIILEHDGGGNRSETVAALGIVIPQLLDHGYRFVTP